MKTTNNTNKAVKTKTGKKTKFGIGSDNGSCHVCGLTEEETYQEVCNWHGCNCGRWYHANCTKISGKTPSDFSCHKVNTKFGLTCTVRRPKDIGKRSLFLPPRKKEVTSTQMASEFSGCEPPLENSPNNVGFKQIDLKMASSEIRPPVAGNEFQVKMKNINFEPAKVNAEEDRYGPHLNNASKISQIEELKEKITAHRVIHMEKQTSEDKRPWPNCIPPGKKGYTWNPWIAFKLAKEYNPDCEFEPRLLKEGREDIGKINEKEASDDLTIEDTQEDCTDSRIKLMTSTDSVEMQEVNSQSKIDLVIESVVKSYAVVDCESDNSGVASTSVNQIISKKFGGSSKTSFPSPIASWSQNPETSRTNSFSSEFCTPVKSKGLDELNDQESSQKKSPTPIKLSNKGLRTNSKRILPSKSIAAVLKNVNKRAYNQYCLETDPEPKVPEVPKVKRRRQGHPFPSAEEIENGAKEYDVPNYRAFGRRANTIITKIKELVEGTKCADAVVDIIPNFDSKSELVDRLTFISKEYFQAADQNGGQLQVEELPQPVRASSIELPDILLRPKGPVPDQDTGALEKPHKDVECDICKVEFGSEEDNELGDYLLGCWADRLCSTSKMYHLSCYFPQARVICDYDKPEELGKFRALVFCSRTCMLLAKKRDSVDEDGLKLGKGKRRKKTVTEEIED